MSKFATLFTYITLGRLRTIVQALMLFVTVYGAALVGVYTADKISNALPALSCAYDQADGGYCVLIPSQHVLHHRVGEAILKAKAVTFDIVLPFLMMVVSFFAFYFFLGKAFCGWVCPLGTLQDWISRIGRRFQRPLHRADGKNLSRLRAVKWVFLSVLVLGLPLATGLGVTPHSLGNPWCDVCPSRIATTLLTGSTGELALPMGDATRMALHAFGNAAFGFIAIAALSIRLPFCRVCPLLAWNALFQRFSPMRLVKREKHDKCDKCGICREACPMDIREIHTESGRKAFHEDCTLCGRCAEFCPEDGLIALKFGPWQWFASSREYYKNRVRSELPHGEVKVIRIVRKADKAAGDVA